MNRIDFTGLKETVSRLKAYIDLVIPRALTSQTKESLSLENVDNTADVDKSVKYATAAGNGIDAAGEGLSITSATDETTGAATRTISIETLSVGTSDDTSDTESMYGILKATGLTD